MSKGGLGVLFGPAIAVGVEQDFARGKDRALAIMLDRASFQHEAEPPHWCASEPGDIVAHAVVAGKVELSSPAVELESERSGVFLRARKNRSGVAEPNVSVFRRHDLGTV